jgi:hypothetical protein
LCHCGVHQFSVCLGALFWNMRETPKPKQFFSERHTIESLMLWGLPIETQALKFITIETLDHNQTSKPKGGRAGHAIKYALLMPLLSVFQNDETRPCLLNFDFSSCYALVVELVGSQFTLFCYIVESVRCSCDSWFALLWF